MNLYLLFVASGIAVGAVYALSGVGLVVLYRASGTLNFAFGAQGAIGAFCAWQLLQYGYPPAVGWAVGILVSTAVAYAYGLLVAPRLRHRDRVVRAVGTLGFALLLMGLTGWIWSAAVPRRINLPTDHMFVILFSVRMTYTRLLALGLALAMVLGIWLLLERTRIGLYMRALAAHRETSSLIGIRVVSVDATAWLISGIFSGIAGVLLAGLVQLNAVQLTFLVIPAIAAAIFGRLQSLAFTALGGLAMGIVEALLTMVPWIATYRSAAPFLMAAVFLTLVSSRRLAAAQQ